MDYQRTFSYCAFLFYLVFLNIVHHAKQIPIAKKVEDFDFKNSISNNSLKIVHPQILIITDQKFSSIFSNESEVSKYVVSFWESVNESFSQLDNPQVQLHISGIVQMKDLSNHNIVSPKRRKNLLETLNPLKLEFDVAVIMSGQSSIDASSSNVIGYSVNGLACNFPNNLAVITDDGRYRTIFPAAHELAHKFSAQHDYSNDNSKCSASEQNIMSYVYSESNSK